MPRWRSARARIIAASRPGRNAEPPPCRALISMRASMIRPRSIRSACIASIDSIDLPRGRRDGLATDKGRPSPSGSRTPSRPEAPQSIHRFEEVRVGLRLTQLAEQELDRIDRSHRIENSPQDIHFLENIRGNQQLLLPRARSGDVHRREGALVGDLAVEDDFRIARALELFENDFVHARAGIDQGGRDDGQRPAFLDIARRAEKPLRPLQRVGVDAAGQHLAR